MGKIALRKIQLSDKKYFAKWWRDKDLLRLTSGISRRIPDQEIEKYFKTLLNNQDAYHFIVILNKKIIGHISLTKRKNNWYETQIIIGEKEYWNKGYGTKAIQLLIKKAKKIGISDIFLEVRSNNLRAIRAYEKVGFAKVGIKKYPKNKYLPETLKMALKDKENF